MVVVEPAPRTETPPFAFGFHVVASPDVVSSAAMWSRAGPPMVGKAPPAYTFGPPAHRVATPPFAFGFQAVASPVAASSAAMWLRVCPPILVKSPPAYTL